MSVATLEIVEPKRPTPVPSPAGWVKLAAELSAEFKPTAVERERRSERPVEPLRKLRETRLVNLLIPRRFGGEGGTIVDATRVITELCKGDASIGALLGYHYINSAIPRLFDFVHDAREIESKSAANRWLWGNVSQPWEKRFRADPQPGGGFLVNGVKAWNTGPSLADVTTVLAPRSDRKEFLFAYIPTDRKGLTYHNDWDHLGLRLTDTVTITFEDVEVQPEEVIVSTHGEPQVGFPPFYWLGTLIFASYYVGSVLGALETARDYTRTRTHPRPGSGLASATQDPYILVDYGDMWTQVQALQAFIGQVAEEAQDAWERRRTISAREVGEVATRVAAVRVFAAKVGLEVTPRVYDVTGARASANSYGFDRYWRDIRTHTLHDPIIYSTRAVGDYFLNNKPAELPPFYL